MTLRETDQIRGHPFDSEDGKFILNWIRYSTPRYAKMKGKINGDKSVTLTNADSYFVDIYDNGFTNDPTVQDIQVYSLDINETYTADTSGNWGQKILISLGTDNVGLIMPARLPRDSGQYKVLMLIDGGSPGTPYFDYPRFS